MQRSVLTATLTLLGWSLVAQPVYPITFNVDSVTHPNPVVKGVWKSIGNSYLLDATGEKIILYSTTSQHCYTEKNDYLSGLLNSSAPFSINSAKDTLSIFLHDFGEKTRNLQSENKYYRLPDLPKNCKPLTAQQLADQEFLFELYWLTLRENYANTTERQLNWNEIYLEYRPKISSLSTKYDLFDVMGQIVTLTRDQHTKIIRSDGETKQYRGEPSSRLLRQSFERQDSIKTYDEYIDKFFSISYQHISNDLLNGKGKKVADGKLEWGDITPTIGYIHIHAFTRFTDNALPRKQHIDTLDFHMQEIMKVFQNKKAVIVDVSFNFGGYDAAGLTIAGYFTKKEYEAYTVYRYQQGKLYQGSIFKVMPAPIYNFTGPVFLLTTDISRSAAESFAMQMKVLPNVTMVGTNTLGILSNMLNKSIGEFVLTLSHEKYITPKGKTYEVSGVDVDIPLEVFTRENMFNGHRDAVRKIVEMIERKSDK